jgi:hypothetical protein
MSADLADRFEAVQSHKSQEQHVQEVKKLWYEELSHQVILFGEAKKGQKFADVVATDPNYCKWFLKKWGASPKNAHQTFSLFLGLWIERQELEQGKSPGGNASTEPMPPKVLPACPKAKGKPMTTGGKSSVMEPINLEIEDERANGGTTA